MPVAKCYRRALLALAVAVLLVAPAVAAETPRPTLKTTARTGESLGSDLLKGLSVPAHETPASATPPPIVPDGEDLGEPSGESPLSRIEAGMRQAQNLLTMMADSTSAERTQQQVVAELDALIKQLAAQCKACSGGQCQNPSSRRSQASAPKPSSSKSAGRSAAQESTARMDSGTAVPAEIAPMDSVLKDVWGHLPERVREQLLQLPADEFLPKYQLEIEEYFRRLAEEETRDEVRP